MKPIYDYMSKHTIDLVIKDNIKKILYETQNGRCRLCGKEIAFEETNLDHDHETDRIRGLVCNRCNSIMALADAGKSPSTDVSRMVLTDEENKIMPIARSFWLFLAILGFDDLSVARR